MKKALRETQTLRWL